MIARPGKIPIHGISTQYSLESTSIRPQEGIGGGRPIPRKERPASAKMLPAIISVETTTTGPRQFGNKWPMRILKSDWPKALAPNTNSLPRIEITWPRTIRATPGQPTNPKAAKITTSLGFSKTAKIPIVSNRLGKAKKVFKKIWKISSSLS